MSDAGTVLCHACDAVRAEYGVPLCSGCIVRLGSGQIDAEQHLDDQETLGRLTEVLLGNYVLSYAVGRSRKIARGYMERRKARVEQRQAIEVAPTAPDSGQPERVSPPPGGAGAVVALDRGSR
jgi:hypothetical protein